MSHKVTLAPEIIIPCQELVRLRKSAGTTRLNHIPSNGEGEWKVRENSISDDDAVEALLEKNEQEVAKFVADGAYDKRKVYDGPNAHSPKVDILIPSRKNARIWKHGDTKAQRLKRDENLRSIRKHGRKEWKKKSGYHARSLAETTMFRLKTIFGNELSARLLEIQATQALLVRCTALNWMTRLSMPQIYKAA